MKNKLAVLFLGSVFCMCGSAAELKDASANSGSSPKTVGLLAGERGPNHKTWHKITQTTDAKGQITLATNLAYLELAAGLHYQDEKGQWQEAREEIEVYPGGAIARHGAHQVIFANNLADAGPIDMQTAEGQRLRSQVLGLYYLDKSSGKVANLGSVKDCKGVIDGNRVIYADAFDKVKADVRYTYTRSGLEQDVILREQLPVPDKFGLNPKTTRLTVLTEFLDAPKPAITLGDNPSKSELVASMEEDQRIDFGGTHMAPGRAFSINSANEDASAVKNAVPVIKKWFEQDGRRFLFEEVSLPLIQGQLDTLPKGTASLPRKGSATLMAKAGKMELPPRRKPGHKSSATMQMAALSSKAIGAEDPRRGFVLDYQTLGPSLTNFTFQSDQTYFVSGRLDLYGTTTFEAGAVIKCGVSNSLYLVIADSSANSVQFNSRPERLVTITSCDDDSVGEIIAGSSGNPSPTGLTNNTFLTLWAMGGVNMHDVRLSYGHSPIWMGASSGTLANVQVLHSYYPFWGFGANANLRNMLLHDTRAVAFWLYAANLSVEHLTVDGCGPLAENEYQSTMSLTNSLLVGVQSLGTVPLTTNSVAITGTNTPVFQSAIEGGHFLAANSPYRDLGTASIDPTLLATLRQMTTFAPPQLNADTNALDLGFHYPRITDSDQDGLDDNWELQYFTNLNQTAEGDFDGDGLKNWQEAQAGTNPTLLDTDGDGLTDSEEMDIPIDVNHPEWGHLDPLKKFSGHSKISDADLDSDHDGLSNIAELNHYLSNPANPHTYSAGLNDAEFFHIARGELISAPPPPPEQIGYARLRFQPVATGNQIQFTITEADAGARYDLYFVNNLISPRWKWRRVFCDAVCDANGAVTFSIQQPDPNQGYFVILDANDSDGDGLTDGYETWFTYNGGRTSVTDKDSDLDNLPDGWEVEYGLDPTSGTGANGMFGNPDADAYSNFDEYGAYNFAAPSYDPLKMPGADRPVITIAANDPYPLCAQTTFTITRNIGQNGSLANQLRVFYCVGGSLKYGTDYTLSPAPPGLPRIYSVLIPAGQQSVTVTASLIGNAVSAGAKTLTAAITPFAPSPATPVSDPLLWNYVVDWNNNRATATFDNNNLRPTADDQFLAVCPNADASITLTGTDGCNDPLAFTVLTQPAHGTLTGTAPNLVYHPSLNYLGPDSFTFKANDGVRDSLPGTIHLNVDNTPAADPQSVQICRNETKPITLTGSGGCSQPLVFTVVTQPAHGTLTGTAPNLTYQPALNYEGHDEFTFKVNNGLQNSAVATVDIEVGYVPVADDQIRITDLSRPISITLTGSDPCNDPLTFSTVTSPALGALSGTPPTLTYTASGAGEDSFEFKANDGVRNSQNNGTVSIKNLPNITTLTAVCRPASIRLHWSYPAWAISYVDDFIIYRSVTAGGPYTQISTVAGSITSYVDSGVVSGTTYYYVVTVRYTDASAQHESAYSNQAGSSTCEIPPIRSGFDANFLDRNDDDSTGLLNLPFAINFYGTQHSALYANNNGNVTFDAPRSQFTPQTLVSLGVDIIAPFWADVDTRAPLSDVMRYGTGTVGGRTAFGVTWVDVGYFRIHDDLLNSFQMILIDRADRATGDYDVEFNYAQIQWETGDVSGGSGGFGGASARAGFEDGCDFFVVLHIQC